MEVENAAVENVNIIRANIQTDRGVMLSHNRFNYN